MRPATVVAAIGGLVLGHVLWLVGISFATDASRVSFWVLILAAVIAVVAAVAGFLAWQSFQRKRMPWAAFLACLPISPVIFTLIVLGVTYL
ncbi:hypothetical protein ORI20_23690 [Mycobacterium sp. CVI_P3]|uniref:Transmembrane protein n=1 Tax=Mycobacterium pinniadriaticum TaxID=2994102 RepID=A0ABT3SK08_9MYCO|nr:hypothetical protein [Mycobacterium pinniadriaticum]MCX2933280.1 hypothetical protein [Mycobacterium pinniadriaticum]MCX2939702.1 hypothetical protein [Mycobacterium pinniadriaticum]